MTVYVVTAKYCLSIYTRVMRELFLHKQNVGINSSAAIPKQQIDLLKIFVLAKRQIRNRFSVFVFSNDDNLFFIRTSVAPPMKKRNDPEIYRNIILFTKIVTLTLTNVLFSFYVSSFSFIK